MGWFLGAPHTERKTMLKEVNWKSDSEVRRIADLTERSGGRR